MSTLAPTAAMSSGVAHAPKKGIRLSREANAYTAARSMRALVTQLRYGRSELAALESVGAAYKRYDIGKDYLEAAQMMRDEGVSFAEALVAQRAIPEQIKGMIRAGSTSQDVYDNIRRGADLLIAGVSVRKRIIGQLINPAFTIALMLVIMVIFSTVIFPSLTDNFDMLGAEVPLTMRLSLAIIGVVKYLSIALIIAAVVATLWWVFVGKTTRRGRVAVSRMGMSMPVVGPILKTAATARLYQLFSANLSTTMREADALEAAGRGCGEAALEDHTRRFAEAMRSEDPPPTSQFADTKYIRETDSALVTSTTTSTQMIDVMEATWPDLEQEAELETNHLEATLQPIISYTVYGFFGFMLVIMALPMYSILTAVMDLGGVQ